MADYCLAMFLSKTSNGHLYRHDNKHYYLLILFFAYERTTAIECSVFAISILTNTIKSYKMLQVQHPGPQNIDFKVCIRDFDAKKKKISQKQFEM